MVQSAPDVLAMADAPPSVRDLPAPRRAAIGTLFTEILATERDLAQFYGDFARQTTVPHLRAALEELAAAQLARVSALARLAPELAEQAAGAPAVPAAPGPADAVPRRSGVFARAFHGERILENDYREMLALLGDPAVSPELVKLAQGSARLRSLLRTLYVWYS